MLTPMNYRRGFHRVYVVCSVLWIGVMLALAVRDRPRKIDYDALAKKYGAVEVDPNSPFTVSPEDFLRHEAEKAKQKVTRDETRAPSSADKKWIVASETPLPSMYLQFWETRSSIALLPPTVGYLLLFVVVPWVYRGFRPGTDK